MKDSANDLLPQVASRQFDETAELRSQLDDALLAVSRLKREVAQQGQTAPLLARGASQQEHSVWGRLLVDQGKKKLYLASAHRILDLVPIWSQQRPFDEMRVIEIARKLESGQLPGVISAFSFEGSGVAAPSIAVPQSHAIYDGQHRMHALKRLYESHDRDMGIVVELHSVSSMAEVVQLYVDVNKAEPVQELDLPDAIATEKKRLIDRATSALKAQYPAMFKPSRLCRVPHLHLPTLRQRLFEHRIVEHHQITTVDQLLCLLDDRNAQLSRRKVEQWPARVRPHLAKCIAQSCYLGLTNDWLD